MARTLASHFRERVLFIALQITSFSHFLFVGLFHFNASQPLRWIFSVLFSALLDAVRDLAFFTSIVCSAILIASMLVNDVNIIYSAFFCARVFPFVFRLSLKCSQNHMPRMFLFANWICISPRWHGVVTADDIKNDLCQKMKWKTHENQCWGKKRRIKSANRV